MKPKPPKAKSPDFKIKHPKTNMPTINDTKSLDSDKYSYEEMPAYIKPKKKKAW